MINSYEINSFFILILDALDVIKPDLKMGFLLELLIPGVEFRNRPEVVGINHDPTARNLVGRILKDARNI